MKTFDEYWDKRIEANQRLFNDRPGLANFAYDEAAAAYEHAAAKLIPNAHFTARVWIENGRPQIEVNSLTLFEPSLTFMLKEGTRPVQDWWHESMEGELDNSPGAFLPDGLELYDEPIWLEVIGRFTAQGYKDYWGEYDEDFEFEIDQWTVAIDGEDEDEDEDVVDPWMLAILDEGVNDGKCTFCSVESDEVVRYRQRTQYVNESDNWVNACPACKEKNDAHWDEMWADLNNDIRAGLSDT